jgi:hypothetical protein
MVVSQTGARRGLDNTPPPELVDELERLTTLILQPLRDRLGQPVVITSGYRSPEVNAAVGGARNSAHLYGRAADIYVPTMSTVELARTIVSMNLPFDQLIDEFSSWVHVAIAPKDTAPRRQQLTARRSPNGGTWYTYGSI